MDYALDRNTLTNERECTSKSNSAQILTVLDAMGCLAYEMKL